MSQERIAEATGLTSVHVNRTLRALREEGALLKDTRKIRIADWSLLQRIAAFDQGYLHCAA
jgi:CRP-like cAMP-binding protein